MQRTGRYQQQWLTQQAQVNTDDDLNRQRGSKRAVGVSRRWRMLVLRILVLVLGIYRLVGAINHAATAAEIVRVTADNYADVVPQGKEVDAIIGDWVIRNDTLVAVIADPVAGRKANMTVRDVGGCVIDLTERRIANDQLSAYYPGANRQTYSSAELRLTDGTWAPGAAAPETVTGPSVALRCVAPASDKKPEVRTTYELAEGARVLRVVTEYLNPHSEPVPALLQDSFRTDRSFTAGVDSSRRFLWIDDQWWRQTYGVIAVGLPLVANDESIQRARPFVSYQAGDQPNISVVPNGVARLERLVFPAANQLEAFGLADQLQGITTHRIAVEVRDANGPVDRALVAVRSGQSGATDGLRGAGRTQTDGQLALSLPAGVYQLQVSALGRADVTQMLTVQHEEHVSVRVELPGYLQGTITDEQGNPIACKLELRGIEGTESPDLGPDTEVWRVKNLIHSENGTFLHDIPPGTYETIISHGPEYDAIFGRIVVRRGEVTPISGKLIRSVDTTGWVSADFHSHSTPSGDNTSSQLGRVLNLLVAHIEFAPCTEHNRISTYDPHLTQLDAVARMATCTGMELTGSLLPVNHQNAFPLQLHRHQQDGGGPQTDDDPVAQIERLALWDQGSDKLVQENHPDLVQVFGDRELDGTPDEGFRKMLGFMDVMEVHPLHPILNPPKPENTQKGMGNAAFHWMQLLNLGYRIPGVVNTDAHYNFHGSGGLRNYLRSRSDRPDQIDTMEMVHSAEHGHVTMSNGPFLEVSMQGAKNVVIPGDDLVVSEKQAELSVRVQCPNWHTINRVQVLLNGRPHESLNYHHANARTMFLDGTVKFDQKLSLKFDRDTHVIVVALGEGLKLGPVIGPAQQDEVPIAVSNPIFVDVDGQGFQANQDLLGVPLPGVDHPVAEESAPKGNK